MEQSETFSVAGLSDGFEDQRSFNVSARYDSKAGESSGIFTEL